MTCIALMWIPYLFPQIRASMRRRKSTPIAKSRKTTPPSPNTRYQPHRHHKGFVYSLFSISHSLLFLLSFLFSLSPLFPSFFFFFCVSSYFLRAYLRAFQYDSQVHFQYCFRHYSLFTVSAFVSVLLLRKPNFGVGRDER